MNSRQRRRDRKLWRYSIATIARDWYHYVEMWDWLKEKHGVKASRCGWRDRIINRNFCDQFDYQVVWQFINERDAIEFALRWV